MAANALTEEQRLALIEWLAAGYPLTLLRQLFAVRGWEFISRQGVEYHRAQHREEIDRRAVEREARAYDAGLAQREERVRQLVRHAEALAELMWLPDEKGKLHNEKAWRETLDDIAKELGHRRTGVDVNVGHLTDAELAAEAALLLGHKTGETLSSE